MSFCLPITSDVEYSYLSEENYKTVSNDDNYGYITIPKIGLKNKFIENGNIDKNIIVISPSDYPNKNNSLLILAGHSGTGRYAYFNYLYKLNINDKIIITYMGINYEYRVIKSYKQTKDGNIKIYKIKDKNTLALVTCTNNDKKTQTVYLAVS